MSFIYPANPVVGQDYTINGKSLRYNGIGFIPSPHTSDQAPDVLTEILPTDYIGGRRSVTGAEWTFETLRDKISERYSETAVVDATGGYGPFNFASIPNEFEIENIEIYADVDNTPSIFIKFENQTDVFSGIIGSTTLIFGKTLLIEGATTIGCFAPYTPISQQFTYRVRNVYGSARRLQLAFGSMGNPAHYTIKTTFRRIP